MQHEATLEPYKYKTYDELRQKLLDLVDRYPDMLRRESADQAYGIKHKLKCGEELCIVDIITMTNFRVRKAKKQILISSGTEGDEKLGPHVITYFIEYLAAA